MFYIVDSEKSFYEVTCDLEPVVQRLGFVLLHVHDLGATLRRKDIELDDECAVFEVGNYRQMERMLAIDIRLGLALPWRIMVFTDNVRDRYISQPVENWTKVTRDLFKEARTNTNIVAQSLDRSIEIKMQEGLLNEEMARTHLGSIFLGQ